MATTLTLLLITTIAVARVTRLITVDKIFEPFREWLIRVNGDTGWITYLAFCPWCMSVWVSTALVPPAWFLTHAPDTLALTSWIGLPLTVLAVAHLAALILTKENR